MAGIGSFQSVIEHSRRIAARFGANHFGPRALAPDLELLDGRCAKCICGTKQNRFPLRPQRLRELTDAGSFSGAVHPDNQDHLRKAFCSLHRRSVCGVQNRQQLLFQQVLEFLNVLDLLAVCAFAQAVQNLVSSSRAKVGPK